MIITIDGVAASGKSSVSSGVARALNIPYVSSGLYYRAATLLALDAGLDLHAASESSAGASALAAAVLQTLKADPVHLEPLAAGNRVWQNVSGERRELTDHLHSTRIDKGVSVVAALSDIRAWVDTQLRQLPPPFVAEGRDMGTNVFPQAQAKFYLTASARIRAERRSQERPDDIPAIEAALVRRDELDRVQSAPAADARIIDTGPLDLPGVIGLILAEVRQLKEADSQSV